MSYIAPLTVMTSQRSPGFDRPQKMKGLKKKKRSQIEIDRDMDLCREANPLSTFC